MRSLRWVLAATACLAVVLCLCALRPQTSYESRLHGAVSRSEEIILFIPSVDRHGEPIDQERWVGEALETLGRLFGGATALPKARGVWRDDAQGQRLIFDEPVLIQCYTTPQELDGRLEELRQFLMRMATEGKQGAVGLVIEGDYFEIASPPAKSGKS